MTEEEKWNLLIDNCRCTQEAFLAMECKVKKGMTCDETMQWLHENFNFIIINFGSENND